MVLRSPQPVHLPTLLGDGVANNHKCPSHSGRWWQPTMWQDLTPSEMDMLLLSLALKLLLFPSYHSTDFEVHRNWLAITYSLPISRWYYDTTSEWTLDYPPFFAYFEKLLSIPASFVDPAIVDLHNIGYNSWSVIAYQRTTVMLSELLLGVVLLKLVKGATDPSRQRILAASIFFHPGFLIIDHIHFQYNGFLFGILLWSILMSRDGRKLASGVVFAVLLNFKHIYIYLAPAYFIYLLRSYCMSISGQILFARFTSLVNAVLLVFALSLGPFILIGQAPQLLSRLFPFARGLNHAYWAPNAWALLTAGDRVLLLLARTLGLSLTINEQGITSTSRGLVGDTVFAVVPDIKPLHTFVITASFQAVYLAKLWKVPTHGSFLCALALCGFASFMFGWHVHEKAIILVLVPLSLLATNSYAYFKTWMMASIPGVFSLFPLLFTPAETPVKIIYSLVWGTVIMWPLYRQIYESPSSWPLVVLEKLENAYLVGFVYLQAFVLVFPMLAGEYPHVQFLPLMITSVYCAIGLAWAFVRLSIIYLRELH